MASATNTKKPSFDKLLDLYWSGPERRISALTLRIIGINALSLIVLMLGVINLGKYENEILTTKLTSFQENSQLIAEIISLTPQEDAKTLIKWLSDTKSQQITYLDSNKNIIYQAGTIKSHKTKTPVSIQTLRSMATTVLTFLPKRKSLPTLPDNITTRPDVQDALQGQASIAAWQNNGQNLILTSTVPLYANEQLIGAIHFARTGDDITRNIGAFWGEMLKIFLLTLAITTLISIYLSGTIARPLKKLMRAAEQMRRNKSPDIEIPDFSNRYDEIGELSLVMRDMTESLHTKINSIESFAADVTHELKNPLTSLKSAVETLKIAKKKSDQAALLNVLQHDIERMDRLITDIAAASRLDTELARQPTESIHINTMLDNITARYQNQNKALTFTLNTPTKPLWVNGLPGRLMQVFDNILSNAVSFAQPQDEITITLQDHHSTITIIIADQGPGIPDNKLENIFDRFYSHRPDQNSFGQNSGLGLAICKQIITALNGTITAENIKTAQGQNSGARFIITLKKA